MNKIEFEIQVEEPKSQHGWKAIGGREGRLYLSENIVISTRRSTTSYQGPQKLRCGRAIEELKTAMVTIRMDWQENWIKPRELRIVKIETVVTYEIVE